MVNTDNSSIDKVETSLEQDEYFSLSYTATEAANVLRILRHKVIELSIVK